METAKTPAALTTMRKWDSHVNITQTQEPFLSLYLKLSQLEPAHLKCFSTASQLFTVPVPSERDWISEDGFTSHSIGKSHSSNHTAHQPQKNLTM